MIALLAAALALPWLGCLPNTNPCDPNSPEDLQGTIELLGSVTDQNGNVLSGITVAIGQTGSTATTNDEGQFSFSGLPPRTTYDLVAYPESPNQGGTIVVGNLGCGESRDGLAVPVIVPPSAPEIEITAATAPDRLFVAFPSVRNNENSTVEPIALDDNPSLLQAAALLQDCDDEVRSPAAKHRYWLEVRSPFGNWQRALLNVDPRQDANAPAGASDRGAYNEARLSAAPIYLGESCLRTTCGFFSYQYDILNLQQNARCTEVIGVVNDNLTRSKLDAFTSYQVRVRVDALVLDDDLRNAGLPPAVVSPPSAAPARLSLTPVALQPVSLSGDDDADAAHREVLDISSIVPVADGRFALIDRETIVVVGAGSAVAQIRNEVDSAVVAMASENEDAAEVEGGMFFDDVTSAATETEVSAQSARAVDVLPAGKWVRVWKRLANETSMIDKVWIGDSWGTAPANSSPPQLAVAMDVNAAVLNDKFVGFRWLGAIEGDPTDLDAPYNPPDAYLLVFTDGVAMVAANTEGTQNEEDLLASATAASDSGENPSFYDDVPGQLAAGEVSICDAMSGAMGSYSYTDMETETETDAFGACMDMKRTLGGVRLSDVDVLRTSADAFETGRTMHIFADAASDSVQVVMTEHLLAKNLPDDKMVVSDVFERVIVGLEPVALQPSFRLLCDGLTEISREPVMLVANRGSQDVSVLRTVENELGANPRFSVEELEVISLPIVPQDFFGDLTGPKCGGPYSWVVGDAGQMYPIDMRTLSLSDCQDGPCSVETRSRARAGAISRDALGSSRVLIGGEGVLSEIGFLAPSRIPSLVPAGPGGDQTTGN